MARDLQEDITSQRLDLYFQPQIDLCTGKVAAVEALSRWTHSQLGPIAPAHFVALAEATGIIHALGLLVLQQGCRFSRRWREGGRRLQVAINVSPMQLSTEGFFAALERELRADGGAAADLTLEVTETEQIEDYPTAAARLQVFRKRGVTISIDDYGSGHSSMDRALALHADELKLDRGVIGRADAAEIASAARVAHTAGMRVVAEGIETAEQLQMVRTAGCDRAQGYYIGRPSPDHAFEQWLAKHEAS